MRPVSADQVPVGLERLLFTPPSIGMDTATFVKVGFVWNTLGW
jgi:hypothetical protein